MAKNLFKLIISIIILGGIFLAGIYFFLSPAKLSQKFLTPEKAAQKAVDFINKNILEEGNSATLINVSEESGLYKFKIKIGEREYISFVTKDGKILFPEEGINLDQKPLAKTNKPSTEVPKNERPEVKLFVMSYCPFGLQMEKAILPVWELLKNKAEIGIYFVSYLMHGKKEMEENLRQYCLQKEEKEKFLSYLNCFVEEGKFEDCLKEANIDQNKLKSCQEITDREFKISASFSETGYPPFNVHKDLNEKYGVRGSPTLVINDQVIEVERSPEKVKEAICNAFLTPPPECNTSLSSNPASPGFGLKTGSAGGGVCQ